MVQFTIRPAQPASQRDIEEMLDYLDLTPFGHDPVGRRPVYRLPNGRLLTLSRDREGDKLEPALD